MSIKSALLELRGLYGSFDKVAQARGVNRDYLYRLFNGARHNPSEALLKRLGVKREVRYVVDHKEHRL